MFGSHALFDYVPREVDHEIAAILVTLILGCPLVRVPTEWTTNTSNSRLLDSTAMLTRYIRA